VLVNPPGRLAVPTPHDSPLQDQIERYSLIEAGWPLHRNQKALSRLEISIVLKEQAVAADIHGLTSDEPEHDTGLNVRELTASRNGKRSFARRSTTFSGT
jgi:hypothetical protein